MSVSTNKKQIRWCRKKTKSVRRKKGQNKGERKKNHTEGTLL